MIKEIPLGVQVLLNSLQKLETASIGPRPEYADILVHPYAFCMEGQIKVSGEYENNQLWCDYYGEYMHGMCWINPLLEAWAKKHNAYWEWENPGCIVLVCN